MQPSDIVGGRFVIERRAAVGGMGEVFQGRDLISGEGVAIKVLLDDRSPDDGRFAREAAVLAGIQHPGVVRYVAHGTAASGAPFLAMEWLEGEDLAKRLAREALTVDETVTLITRAAEALAAAHAHGVVHRDLTPGNLFLVGGDVARIKVLDFGLARFGDAARMTRSGAIVGTPGYMAPEQARGEPELDARVDVFALGCVLFECLTGQPAFSGERFLAVLAKILFAESPRVRELRPEISPGLDALCARMLAKDREGRPQDGAAVAAGLEAVGLAATLPAETARTVSVPSSALTRSERRMLSVILIGQEPRSDGEARADAETQIVSNVEELRRVAAARGGTLEPLIDGSMLVSLDGAGIATDQAAKAARCALALRALVPERPMALATGRAEVTGKLPSGDAIDRVAQMLTRLTHLEGVTAPISMDDVTARLLDARFDVVLGSAGLLLHGERDLAEGARTLLGKTTTCVGRTWEIASLDAFLNDCITEPMARAVLVTAPPGMGKSRLASELMRRVRERGEHVEIWIGRADSLRAGSAFGLLGQAIRSALGIQEGEPPAARQEKLRARIGELVAAPDRPRITGFLGELVGTPFPDEESMPLRAARQDAQLMGEQMRAAWVDFLKAETSAHPVLLVLEDLHWGDLPTVRFVDTALRELHDKPWMVVALARPEVHELFPKLWGERGLQELRLKELTRRASERLVRQVLGESVSPETVERIITQAEGHAFYLEELIRAVAEGKGAALPETVLAMVEARLAALDSEARRVLRAASVFGEVCWQGGVSELLGGAIQPSKTASWLQSLVEREVLVRRPESRFPGEVELAFRHALLREGAYATLTEEDRALGHRLAGAWLEQRGEGDPRVLAEHFERGRESARAGSHYLRASQQAHRGGDASTAVACAKRGLDCDVAPDLRGALLGQLCEIYVWSNEDEYARALPYAEEAMRLTMPGSVPWTHAASAKLMIAILGTGNPAEFMATLDHICAVEPLPDAVAVLCFSLGVQTLLLDGAAQPELAEATLLRAHAVVEPLVDRDPLAWGWLHTGHARREAPVNEDPWAGLQHAERAFTRFTEADHQRGLLFAHALIGLNAWSLGAFARAERALRPIPGADEKLGRLASVRPFCLSCVLADQGALEEARLEATHLAEISHAQHLPMAEGRGRWALAGVLLRLGEHDAAEREAREARALLAPFALEHLATTAMLAKVLLAQGRAPEALAAAEEAMSQYKEARACGFFRGAFVRLVHAEALHAAGQTGRAGEAIAAARARLCAIADKIGDLDLRRSFLEDVPENARTLSLAEAWKGSARVLYVGGPL